MLLGKEDMLFSFFNSFLGKKFKMFFNNFAETILVSEKKEFKIDLKEKEVKKQLIITIYSKY